MKSNNGSTEMSFLGCLGFENCCPETTNHFFKLLLIKNLGLALYEEKCSFSIGQGGTTDKRTDVWSRPSCIYTQIFSPKKLVFPP